MDLRSWLKGNSKEAATDMATRAGTKFSYLEQLAGGHRLASVKLARAIQRETAGAVSVAELRPDIFQPGDQQKEAA